MTDLVSLLSELTKITVKSAIAAFRAPMPDDIGLGVTIENQTNPESILRQMIAEANAERDRLVDEMEREPEVNFMPTGDGGEQEALFRAAEALAQRVDDEIMGSGEPAPQHFHPDQPEPRGGFTRRERVTNVPVQAQMADTISVTAVPNSELLLPTHRNRREHPQPVQIFQGQLRIPAQFIMERDQRMRQSLLSCRNCGQRVQTVNDDAMDSTQIPALQNILREAMDKHVCGATRIQHPEQYESTVKKIRVIRFKGK